MQYATRLVLLFFASLCCNEAMASSGADWWYRCYSTSTEGQKQWFEAVSYPNGTVPNLNGVAIRVASKNKLNPIDIKCVRVAKATDEREISSQEMLTTKETGGVSRESSRQEEGRRASTGTAALSSDSALIDWYRCYKQEPNGQNRWFDAAGYTNNFPGFDQLASAVGYKNGISPSDLRCLSVNNKTDERAQTVQEWRAKSELQKQAADAREMAALEERRRAKTPKVDGPPTDEEPFNGLALSQYLNAIYRQDRDAIRKLDGELVDNMSSLIPSGSPFADLLKSAAAQGSYLPIILRTYLEEYSDRYPACIRKNAVSITIRTTETRGGVSTRSEDKLIKINEEFLDVYRRLGPSQPESGAVLLADAAMGSPQLKAVVGTEELMSKFQCGDRRIKAFEKGLREAYLMSP